MLSFLLEEVDTIKLSAGAHGQRLLRLVPHAMAALDIAAALRRPDIVDALISPLVPCAREVAGAAMNAAILSLQRCADMLQDMLRQQLQQGDAALPTPQYWSASSSYLRGLQRRRKMFALLWRLACAATMRWRNCGGCSRCTLAPLGASVVLKVTYRRSRRR